MTETVTVSDPVCLSEGDDPPKLVFPEYSRCDPKDEETRCYSGEQFDRLLDTLETMKGWMDDTWEACRPRE